MTCEERNVVLFFYYREIGGTENWLSDFIVVFLSTNFPSYGKLGVLGMV
jgi:hypothetical protein